MHTGKPLPPSLLVENGTVKREFRRGEVVHERRRISADAALRLARYFNTNPEFWLILQNFYDLEVSRHSGAASAIEREMRPAGVLVS